LIGLFVGIVIGGGSGAVLGIVVPLLHLAFFDHDTDLERYRQRLAKGVAALITVPTLIVIFRVLADSLLRYPRDREPLEWLLVPLILSAIVFWTVLSSAYTASYYPDGMVNRLIRQGRLKIDHSMLHLGDHEVMQKSDWLLRRIFTIWIFGATLVIAGSLFIAFLMRVPQGLEWVLVAAYGLIVAAGILVLCCGVGNVALIVFLKRLVMPEMTPHRHRVTLTLVSFFYTLVTHWWTLILAPMIALFIAYHVYHTLAIPDDYGDKAKRKEALVEIAA
jgi:hypothetical protein